MLTIHAQIEELRAELANCFLTRRERAQAQRELVILFAKQAELDEAFDALCADDAAPS